MRTNTGKATKIEATHIACSKTATLKFPGLHQSPDSSDQVRWCCMLTAVHINNGSACGTHPRNDLEYEVMLSSLNRVQEQILGFPRFRRVRDQAQKVCHRHTRKKQANRGERELCNIVPFEVIHSRSIASYAGRAKLVRIRSRTSQTALQRASVLYSQYAPEQQPQVASTLQLQGWVSLTQIKFLLRCWKRSLHQLHRTPCSLSRDFVLKQQFRSARFQCHNFARYL